MIRRCAAMAVTAACLAGAAPALAQNRGLTFTAGATAVGPLSGSSRQFNTGFGVNLGLLWNVREQIGIRFDVVQAALVAKDRPQFPASVPVRAEPRLQFATASIIFREPAHKIRLYVVGGVGLYHRSVRLSVARPGPVSVCNPWWFVCFPEAVGADRVNGTRSVTNLGVHVGAGLASKRFFAEMRFHYVWGPSFSTPDGEVLASGRFLPLVAGVRF